MKNADFGNQTFNSLKSGGIAFLNIVDPGGWPFSTLTKFNSDGKIQFSNMLSDFIFLPIYGISLMENSSESIFVLGFTDELSGSLTPTLVKLSSNGTELWNKRFYLKLENPSQLSGVPTWDGGYFFRAKNFFVKLDSLGNQTWVRKFDDTLAGSNRMPLELEDSFLIPSYLDSDTEDYGNDEAILLTKISKDGQNVIFNRFFPTIQGNFKRKKNGNWSCIKNNYFKNQCVGLTLIECDSDFNIIKANFIGATKDQDLLLEGKDFIISEDQSILITGVSNSNNDSENGQLFLAKVKPDNTSECGDSSVFYSAGQAKFIPSNMATNFISKVTSVYLNKITLRIQEKNISTYTVCENNFLSDLGKDTIVCEKQELVLGTTYSSPFTKFLWSNGDTLPEITIQKDGKYWLTATNQCTKESGTDSIHVAFEEQCEILEMPSLFTPNGDGSNDNFIPKKFRGIKSAHMDIYNRWGKKVFSTNDIQNKAWDGSGFSNGVYFWLIKYETNSGAKKLQNSTVTFLSH